MLRKNKLFFLLLNTSAYVIKKSFRIYLHNLLSHSQRQKPHVRLYNHKGEQMSPEMRSDTQRLNMKQLVEVWRDLLPAIANIVMTSPANPTTKKKTTKMVIAKLDSNVVRSRHQEMEISENVILG